MKYLVLRRFRSYGIQFEKGQIVDAEQIRSPHLRQSEGKIIPAVSSFTVPEEFGSEDNIKATSSDGIVEAEDKKDVTEDEKKSESPVAPAVKLQKPLLKKQ